jgi:5-methylcytosine-specific restriction enzyme A
MAKLRTLKPRMQSLSSRLTGAPQNETERSRQRMVENPLRRLYYTARWSRVRQMVFERDGYACRKCGMLCVGKHPAPNSPVCDHIRPHRGDEALFWDERNLQTLCKADHDSAKQAEERRRGGWVNL